MTLSQPPDPPSLPPTLPPSHLCFQVRRSEAHPPEVARAFRVEGEERLGGRHGQEHVDHIEDCVDHLLQPGAPLGGKKEG
jgi:hypothetical protein